jgi:hypothetical protein
MRRTLIPVLACALGLGPASAADDANDYDRNLAAFGAWGHPVPLDLQAQDGISPGEGIVIRWVRPGGPAAQMGLQPGDVLTSLNGNPINSRMDLRNTVIANAPGSAATAVVIHPGGDVAVLDGTFGERKTNRPLRPLTDQWEQDVKQRQLEELDARARALQDLADAADAMDPGNDSAVGGAAGANGVNSAAGGGAAATAAKDADLSGPWFASHRWESSAGLPVVAPRAAAASSDATPAADSPWRFTALVPSGRAAAPDLIDL